MKHQESRIDWHFMAVKSLLKSEARGAMASACDPLVCPSVRAYQFSQYVNLIDEYLECLIVFQLVLSHGLDRILLA